MAGLYPDDQVVTIFGTEVTWPGLDPETHKFTNGDFNDPLIKPSFIPAETINLILDNLSELLVSLGKVPNNQKTDQLTSAINVILAQVKAVADSNALKAPVNMALTPPEADNTVPEAVPDTAITSLLQTVWNKLFYLYNCTDAIVEEKLANRIYRIGRLYIQHPGDGDPIEEDLPGQWAVWNNRAELYGYTASLPAYTAYIAGGNVTANAYMMYESPEGDLILVRAKAAMSNLPQQIDPIQWYWPGDNNYGVATTYIRRRDAQPLITDWLEPDLAIGFRFASGAYSGQYVIGRIVLGGKFLSGAGGNRPTFISGGIAGDMDRPVTGEASPRCWTHNNGGLGSLPTRNSSVSGAFYMEYTYENADQNNGSGRVSDPQNTARIKYDSSRVTPTGLENSPRTLAVRYFRRVA